MIHETIDGDGTRWIHITARAATMDLAVAEAEFIAVSRLGGEVTYQGGRFDGTPQTGFMARTSWVRKQ